MAYQVLATKWRPRDFSTLIGQDHVVKALTHALTHDRLHHAYLFTGTRGVGKTTISRILAKCLNCTGPDGKGGITATPCGVCDACKSIDEDRFIDYIEMDAASTRGIDDMVSLLERAKYAPTNARFKVYMIDEVHQLTPQAFNAMLKTLEEPPPYVKFILATTDPQKVPITVLSRCLQFNLKSLSPMAIAEHMKKLLEHEGIYYENAALNMLASSARGSMRDGLSLLDQAIAFSAEHISVDNVREMLGTVDTNTLYRLLATLAAKDSSAVMAIADEIGARSLSYRQTMKDLAQLLQRVALAQFSPQTINEEESDAEQIKQLAEAFKPEEVQLYYQIAIHARNEMTLAPDEYSGFTMGLLRMMAFAPHDGTMPKKLVVPKFEPPKVTAVKTEAAKPVEPAAPAPEPEPKPKTKKKSAKEASAPKSTKKNSEIPVEEPQSPAPEPVPEPAQIPPQELKEEEPLPADGDEYLFVEDEIPPIDDDVYGHKQQESSILQEDKPNRKTAAAKDKFTGKVKSNEWLEVARNIKLPNESQPLVNEAELESFDGKKMVLSIGLKDLTAPEHTDRLAAALKKELGCKLEVVYKKDRTGQTLTRLLKQELNEEKKKKFSKISSDQRVQEIAKSFDATLSVENTTLFDENGEPRT